MADEEMLDEGVDFAAAFAAELGVFMNGKVAGAADRLRFKEGSGSFLTEVFKLVA
jgi:hypothetical protein